MRPAFSCASDPAFPSVIDDEPGFGKFGVIRKTDVSLPLLLALMSWENRFRGL